jgi:hypothetical protein
LAEETRTGKLLNQVPNYPRPFPAASTTMSLKLQSIIEIDQLSIFGPKLVLGNCSSKRSGERDEKNTVQPI